MLGAPFGDFAVIAREENVRDFHAAKIGGFGVLGIFEVVAIGKAFDFGGGFTTKDAWDKANDGIDNN